MKKGALLVLGILLISLSSAIQIESNSEYMKGETMLTKFSGTFIDPPLESKITFYRDYVRVPVEFYLIKIQEDYYLSALLPEKEGNYKIKIEDVEYMQGTKKIDEPIELNFTITNLTAPFQINPGVLVAKNNFEVDVQNLLDKRLNLQVFYSSLGNSSKENVELNSGESKKIYFNIENFYDTFFDKINFVSEDYSYSIPAYIISNKTQITKQKYGIEFDYNEIDVNVKPNSSNVKVVYLKNIGQEINEEIRLKISNSLKGILNISTLEINDLEPESSVRLDLFFNTSGINTQFIEGFVTAEDDYNNEEELFIYLNISENVTKIDIPGTEKTCREIGGVICGENSQCDGNEERINGINCCVEGECKAVKGNEDSSGGAGKIIGWILVVLVLLFVGWFFLKKYKGTKNEVSFSKFFRKK